MITISVGCQTKTPSREKNRRIDEKKEIITHKTKVEMETNYGTIELELWDDLTPKTVQNFVKLARSGYYDGLYFHRVIPDFMIQGGSQYER